MRFADGQIPIEYTRYIERKSLFVGFSSLFLTFLVVFNISLGALEVSPQDVIKTLSGITVSKRFDVIIWNIRLPQALTAAVAGSALAVAGDVMQGNIQSFTPKYFVYPGFE